MQISALLHPYVGHLLQLSPDSSVVKALFTVKRRKRKGRGGCYMKKLNGQLLTGVAAANPPLSERAFRPVAPATGRVCILQTFVWLLTSLLPSDSQHSSRMHNGIDTLAQTSASSPRQPLLGIIKKGSNY